MKYIITLLFLISISFTLRAENKPSTEQLSMGIGAYHICVAVPWENTVYCKGKMYVAGEWGPHPKPVMSGFRNLKRVVSGLNFDCALSDFGVKCWGDNTDGQATVANLNQPKVVEAGDRSACAIDDEGVKCWGVLASADGTPIPTTLKNPRSLAVADTHGCVLDDEGMKCWGSNKYGQLDVPPLNHPTSIALSNDFSCALDDGGVKCWGSNDHGQLSVPTLHYPRSISAGYKHVCAIDGDAVKCWGVVPITNWRIHPPVINDPVSLTSGYHAVCATNGKTIACQGGDYLPIVIITKGPIREMALGYVGICLIDQQGLSCQGYGDFSLNAPPRFRYPNTLNVSTWSGCARDNEELKCWGGDNSFGELNVPHIEFPVISGVMGLEFTCAHDYAWWQVRCWGDNYYRQLDVPYNLKNVKMIAAGTRHACLLDDSGVQCWGDNRDGQTSVPVLSHPRSVTAGYGVTCVTDDTGVKCWGDNTSDQLSVPTTLKNPRQVSVAQKHVCALDKNEISCWGQGAKGFNIPALKNPRTVSANRGGACVLDDEGLTCWGNTVVNQADMVFSFPE